MQSVLRVCALLAFAAIVLIAIAFGQSTDRQPDKDKGISATVYEERGAFEGALAAQSASSGSVAMEAAELLGSAIGTGWGQDDFLIAGFDQNHIGVYSSAFIFKGILDSAIQSVTGLDFTSNGDLVAVGRFTGGVRRYSHDGVQISSFTHPDLNDPVDIKIGPNDLLYVGTQASNSVRIFDWAGNSLATLGGRHYPSVAILPGNILWAGRPNFESLIDVFDLTSGLSVGSVALGSGQNRASSMFYSSTTNTLLLTDGSLAAVGKNTVFERDLNGGLVRTFSSDEFRAAGATGHPSFGVTRGPDGDVFATTAGGLGRIYRWHADGSYLGSIAVPEVDGPVGIVWAGNAAVVPSPSEMLAALRLAATGVGPGTSLADKVALAQTYFAAHDIQATCAVLADFNREVRAQAGKKLTADKASELTSDAAEIMRVIGCD